MMILVTNLPPLPLALVAAASGTLMIFTHAQFADETARDNHLRGWSSFFDKLDTFVA